MEKTRNLLMYLIAAAIAFWLVLNWGRVTAGELETTWRTGDVTRLAVVCSNEQLAERAAVLISFKRDLDIEVSQNCLVPPPEVFLVGQLKKWISGPYRWGETSMSVWRTVSPNGTVGFAIIPDRAGEHQIAVPV